MARYEADDTAYHGDNATCSQCGNERIEHHGVLFCIIHDNPDIGEGTWFTAWGNAFPGAQEADDE